MTSINVFSNTPPDDMSHVGRAVDFTPGARGILSHFVVCGIAPEDVQAAAAGGPNQRVPAPQVLFHWAPEGNDAAMRLPEQLMDFCFPMDRRAPLQWVSLDSPLLKDALCDPQHETVDPFVFLISGELQPVIGVAISRIELAKVPPPLIVKKHAHGAESGEDEEPPVKPKPTAVAAAAAAETTTTDETTPQQKDQEDKEQDKAEGKEKEEEKPKTPEGQTEEKPETTTPETTTPEDKPKEEAPKKEEESTEVKKTSPEEQQPPTKEEQPQQPAAAPTAKQTTPTTAAAKQGTERCLVAVTRRCYVVLSKQCLLPLLSEMLSAIMSVDFAASADNRRTILDVVLSTSCSQTELDGRLAECAVSVPTPPPLALAMMKYCNEGLVVPKPGESLQFRLPSVAALPQPERTFKCPMAQSVRNSAMAILMEWSLVTLFEYLSLQNVLTVLAAVWCERSVLFVCPNVSVLTAMVFSILAASRPLSWQGIFIPLLPTTMADCIDAPVPYVIGIPCLPGNAAPASHRVEGVLVVDVLRNMVHNWGDEVPAMPEARVLGNKLRPLHESVFVPPRSRANPLFQPPLRGSSKRLTATLSLADVLAEYTTWLLAQVKAYYKTMCAREGRPVSLAALEKSFVASAKRANRAFVASFIGTQQFATYFHWNISLEPPPSTTPPQVHT